MKHLGQQEAADIAVPEQVAPAEKRRGLAEQKRRALFCLGIVALIWATTYVIPFARGLAAFLRSAAEAGLVGGLADWYAVTALFRHPLGLRLPHTAIIPKSRQRIADGLAAYIEREFLQAEMLAERLRKADVANMTERFMLDDENRGKIVSALVGGLPRLLSPQRDTTIIPALAAAIRDAVGDTDLRPLCLRTVSEALKSPALGRLVGEIAGAGKMLLEQHRAKIIATIGQNTGRWTPAFLDRKVAEGVCDAADAYFTALENDGSDERLRLEQWLKTLPAEMEANPAILERAISAAKGAMKDRQLNTLVGLIWCETRDAALVDLGSDQSKIKAGLDAILAQVARELDSYTLRREFNARLERTLVTNVPLWRPEIVAFIKSSLARYDPAAFAGRLEAEVGGDLQMIRISGTVVGCIIGALLYGANVLAQWASVSLHVL